MKKFSVKESEVLIIGDGESDRYCAESINCDFIALENSFSKFKKNLHTLLITFMKLLI